MAIFRYKIGQNQVQKANTDITVKNKYILHNKTINILTSYKSSVYMAQLH